MQTEARIIRWNITDDERELGKRLLSDPDFCTREQKDFGSLIVMKTGLSIAVEPLPDSQWNVYVYHQYADFGMSRYTIRGVDVLTNFIYHVLVKERRGGQNAYNASSSRSAASATPRRCSRLAMTFQLVFWGRCEFCQEIILHEEFIPSSCEQVTGEKCDGEIAELYWRMEVEEEEMAARYKELAREWYSKGWM